MTDGPSRRSAGANADCGGADAPGDSASVCISSSTSSVSSRTGIVTGAGDGGLNACCCVGAVSSTAGAGASGVGGASSSTIDTDTFSGSGSARARAQARARARARVPALAATASSSPRSSAEPRGWSRGSSDLRRTSRWGCPARRPHRRCHRPSPSRASRRSRPGPPWRLRGRTALASLAARGAFSTGFYFLEFLSALHEFPGGAGRSRRAVRRVWVRMVSNKE